MLTVKQLKVSTKREPTQAQRAQIVDVEVARKFVRQAIEEALAVRHTRLGLLIEEDVGRIFTNQPVHFDGMGVPHWFKRPYIRRWASQIYHERYRSKHEQKK